MKKLLLIFILVAVGFGFDIKLEDNSLAFDIRVKTKEFNSTTKYTTKPLIECSPNLRGVLFRVNSSYSISVIPKKFFPSSIVFECQTKDKKYHFSIKTEPFKLKDINLFFKERLLRLTFNDNLAKDTLKENLKIFKKRALSRTELQYKIVNQKGNIALVKILEPLDGDLLEIVLNQNLQNQSKKSLNEKVTKTISLKRKIIPKLNPKLKEMVIFDKPQMVPYKGKYVLRLFFDDSFNSKSEVKPFVEIEGVDSFKIQNMDYISDMQRRDLNISEDSLAYVDIASDDFKPNKTYKVTLKKGLTNYRQLKKDITFEVKTKDLPSFIYFPNDRVYLSSLGDIGFEAVNIQKATLRVEKITPLNYRYFIIFANENISDTSKFTQEIFSKDIILNTPKNIKTQYKFHIKDLAKAKAGIYRIVLNYQEKVGNKFYDKEASKVVFVSDIGINAKVSKDEIFVSLFSLKKNTPIKEAKVEVISKKNIKIASATTSLDGSAKIEIKNLLSKEPKAIIVSFKDDRNFLLLNKPINKISLEKLTKKHKKYRAFIYPQSDIVRPGMDINALVVIKNKDLKSAKISIKVKLVRAKNYQTIFKKAFTTDENGSITLKISTPYYERSGAYFLKVFFGDELIGKKRVDIESFMPPQIENSLSVGECIDNFMDINVSSRYLFGAAASNLEGTLSVRGVEGSYKSAIFSDYNFSTSSKERDLLLLDESLNIKLNDKGFISVKIPCQIVSEYKPSVIDTTIGATIFDGNQPVSTYKKIKIYPYSRVVGINLQKRVLDTKEALKGWAVALNPAKNQKIKTELIGKIYKLNWFYTYEDGNFKWDVQKEFFDSFLIDTQREFSYQNLPDGEYELRVFDPLSGAWSKLEFEVGGWGYSSLKYGTNPKEVTINFEDKEYKKGDNLKVSIKSPITKGKLLLTLERDRVLWHQLYNIEKGSALVDIPLNINLKDGVYLGTLVVRKTDTNSSIIPFRAYGFKLIKSNREDKKIKIDLDINKSVKSNSTTTLKIATNKECSLLVSVVDVGILNITDQKPPNPFKFFTPPATLAVAMFDIYDRVIGYLAKGKLISFGSGEMSEILSRKKHLPPPDTKRVKPFMLWSGILHTKDKKATFKIKVPQFNGKARVSVVAFNKDSIGSKSIDFVVKDDIIIQASAPRFFLEGDKLKLPLKLINTTNKEIKISLKITSSKNLKVSLKNLEFTLKPKEQKSLFFKTEALKVGKAYLKFEANNYKREINLRVNSPYTLQSFIQKGFIKEGESKSVFIPREFLSGNLIVSLSSNLLGILSADLKDLISYPYGCAEQTSSKIGALFWAKGFIKNKLLSKKADLFIREGVRKLTRMQRDSGEFAYWQNGNFVEPYSSIYASDILLKINSSLLPSQSKTAILEALRHIASLGDGMLYGSYNNLLECYSGYLLAREHTLVSKNILNMLYEKGVCQSDKIANLYLAAGFMELNSSEVAREVLNKNQVSIEALSQNREYGYPFGGWKWRLFVAAYLKAKYFGLSERESNLVREHFDSLYSTQDKALAIRATRAFIKDKKVKNIKVELKFANQTKTITLDTALEFKLSSNKLEINSLKGVVAYSLDAYKYLPKPIKNGIDLNSNFGISREFLSGDGAKVDLKNLQLKDEIFAKVTIMNRQKVDNLLIDMRVPSCMEIINSKNYKGKFTDYNIEFNYKDIKDDRVLLSTSLDEKVSTSKVGQKVLKTLSPNFHTFYIPLRVTAIGEYKLPAITAESMYDERFRDYAKEAKEVIVRAKRLKPKLSNKKRVEELIKRYYQLEADSAIASRFIPLFHFPLKNFFGKKYLSSKELMQEISRYNRIWPKRVYRLKSITVKELSPLSYSAVVEFDYTLKRGKRVISGESIQYLKIKAYNNNFLIDSIDSLRR